VSAPANDERAASADAALFAYMFRTSCDCEDCLAGLLGDLMCWAAKCGLSFDGELDRARRAYAAEPE
jgi:hypothetical protein